jgi:hypothetical protein
MMEGQHWLLPSVGEVIQYSVIDHRNSSLLDRMEPWGC